MGHIISPAPDVGEAHLLFGNAPIEILVEEKRHLIQDVVGALKCELEFSRSNPILRDIAQIDIRRQCIEKVGLAGGRYASNSRSRAVANRSVNSFKR